MSESPVGSNKTKFNKWFYGYMVAAPWCAIFVSWVLVGAGFKIKKNAGADELGAQLLRGGWKRITASNIDSGDIVVYTFSHIGICKARLANGKKRVYEGNHGNSSKLVDRAVSTISYGVRPPYSPEVIPKPTPTSTPPAPPGPRHTAYIVHGDVNNDSGRLTDSNGWYDYYPRPAVKSIVYPAPELGVEFDDCRGNHWVPIKWAGLNTEGLPNGGWYQVDHLQWAN